MKLCETCKKEKCNKNIVITHQDNLLTIKCLDYEKDVNKIKGYKQSFWITAHKGKSFMDLNI